MSVVALELGFLFFLILVNGILAMSEIAIVASRRAKLQAMAESGRSGAAVALELASAPETFLSTVQVGITLVGVLAGAFGGATLAEQIEIGLRATPLARWGEAIGVGIVVLAVTYLTLVWGELVPKRIALTQPESIAAVLARWLKLLAKVTSPMVKLLSASTAFTLRVLGVKESVESPVTQEEIEVLLDQGTEAGVFEEHERDLVSRVFKLSDRTVDLLMTPRADIEWLDVADAPDETRRKIIASGHTRYPVCEDGPENLIGTVTVRDILHLAMEGKPIDLRAVLQPPLFVPEGTTAARLLQDFKASRQQFALVVDEHGSVVGAVTLHDIMEAMVGELPSPEAEPGESMVVRRDDGSYLIDGMLPFDDFKELFELSELPVEEGASFKTVGGFVMATLFRIPEEGDRFECGGLRFEVMDMDGRRVDKVLITPVAPSEAAEAAADPASDANGGTASANGTPRGKSDEPS